MNVRFPLPLIAVWLIFVGDLHAQISGSDYYNPEQCTIQLQDEPKTKALIGKLSFDVSKAQPLEMLANQSKPNLKDKAALSYFASEWEKCQDSGQERLKGVPVQLLSLHTNYRLEFSAALSDLYAGKLTYGGYAKLRAKQYADFKVKSDEVLRELEEQRVASEKARQDNEAQAQRQREEMARANERAKRQEIERLRQETDDRKRRYAMESAACKNDASNLNTPSSSSGKSRTICNSFGGQINCETSPKSSFLSGWERGASDQAKREYYRNCMTARGWTKADEP